MKRILASAAAALTLGSVAVASPVSADQGNGDAPTLFEVTVQITNRAPTNGTNQTPFWIGVHDGNFDLYDRDQPLSGPLNSVAMERLVEDGNNTPLNEQFAAEAVGIDANVPGPNGPIAPGETATTTLTVAANGSNQYFSYASMVLPSNDAFVANGDPRAHLLIDEDGRGRRVRIRLRGSDVLDGGTEVNTEGPDDTAFLNQEGPDVGIVEGAVVVQHPGFNAPQTEPFPNILGTERFANADFTRRNYRVTDITVTARPIRTMARTNLSGRNEVPAVKTRARGFAQANLSDEGIEVATVGFRIDNLLFAHLHLGARGENGPVVATLFDGDISHYGLFLSKVTITDADLVGPLEGMSVVELWQEIQDGNIYVNVHSTDFPDGELRGNLR